VVYQSEACLSYFRYLYLSSQCGPSLAIFGYAKYVPEAAHTSSAIQHHLAKPFRFEEFVAPLNMTQEPTLYPPLLNLAIELLDLILYDIHDDDLRALRQTCHQLAYSPSILAKQFARITLHQTPESVRSLQELRFERIAPYVREVAFIPSEHSIAVTRNIFEEIVNWQIIYYVMGRNDTTSLSERGDSLPEIIEKDYLGHNPFYSAKELDKGYETYRQLAREVGDLCIVDVWTAAIGKMSRCTTISVNHLTFDEPRSDIAELKRKPCQIICGHKHEFFSTDQNHKEEVCRRMHAQNGDALFLSVISGLARSHIKPKNLQICHFTNGAFDWGQLPPWPDLDLSELENLRFDTFCNEESEKVGVAAAEALALFQHRSVSTLQRFYFAPAIYPDSSSIFPHRANMIKMPALKHLEVGCLAVHLSDFARFLLLQEKLENLTLYSTFQKIGTGRWRMVWDVIRYHPSRMQLDLHFVLINEDYMEITCSHWTGNASKEGVNQEGNIDMDELDEDEAESEGSVIEDTAYEDIDRSFANYVSNKGPWNNCMKVWFD